MVLVLLCEAERLEVDLKSIEHLTAKLGTLTDVFINTAK